MGLRPARCYTRVHRAFTRVSQRKPRKSYIKGVPGSKIHQFEMGVKGDYPKVLRLIAKQRVQIRHNALEAARMAVTQHLTKRLSKGKQYFMKVRPYPHHVIRENPMATGAGADRFQQGMRMSFGRPIGTAAQVRAGQIIMDLYVDEASVNVAKAALKVASHKIPTTSKITIEDVKK